MFKIIYSGSYYVEINHGGKKIVSPLATQRDGCITTLSLTNVEKKYPVSNIYSVVNRYLDEKGEFFKMELMDTLISVNENNIETIKDKVFKVFDLFNLKDIENTISKYFHTVDLTDNPDTYMITAKTYSKQDYLELCSFLLLVKVIMHIFINHILVNKFNVYTNPVVYFIEIISQHKHFQTKAFLKFLEAIKEDIVDEENYLSLINLEGVNIDETNIELLEAGNILIKKLFLLDICQDTSDNNAITVMYNYLGNQLKNVGNKIQDKQIGLDEDNNDKESLIEAYRQISTINYDIIETYSWLTSDIEKIIRELDIPGISINKDIENHIRNSNGVSESQVELLKIFYINLIPENLYLHLDLNSISNLIIIMYAVINEEFPELAIKLLNKNTGRLEVLQNSLKKDIRQEFIEIFPTVTGGNKKENVLLTRITNLYNKYYSDVDKNDFFKFIIKYLK